jgi:hypothetical protein
LYLPVNIRAKKRYDEAVPKEPASGDIPLVPLERKVAERAREFSLPALLDVLHFLGYRSDQIELRSHLSQVRASSLIHSVEFLPGEGLDRHAREARQVRVTVNLGLLSAQSPLPSYFLKIAERLEGEPLVDFLGYFDHHLLKRRAMGLYPERDRTVFADWGESQTELLQLIGVTSPSSLHFLCERIFPELQVKVERFTAEKPLKAQGAVLGHATLGEGCAFGASTTVPVGGIRITLYSEETLSPTGIPWPTEAARRLHSRLFSILGKSELFLTVRLFMLDQESYLQMLEERFLGYEPLWDPSHPPPQFPQKKPLSRGSEEATIIGERPFPSPAQKQSPKSPAGPSLSDPSPTSSKAEGVASFAPIMPHDPTLARRRIQEVELYCGSVRDAPSAHHAAAAQAPAQILDEYRIVSDA